MESKLSVWKKPSGAEIKINDEPATVKKAIEMGWTNDKHNPGGEKKPEDMSAKELKEKFAEIGEDYPGNKEEAVARLNEIAKSN